MRFLGKFGTIRESFEPDMDPGNPAGFIRTTVISNSLWGQKNEGMDAETMLVDRIGPRLSLIGFYDQAAWQHKAN